MINDKEIINLNQDKLDFKAYVEALDEIIIESETPLTIGVYGEWGTGKTSLMKMTESSLRKRKQIQTVWFDAWKYDKVEDLRVALIFNIIKQIEKDTRTSKQLKVKATNFLKRINWISLAKNVSKLGLSMATPFLAQMHGLENIINSEQVHNSLDLSKILPEELINSVSLESLNFLHEFEKLYEDIVKQYIGKNGKLIVFIDDLDRCLPDKAIDILESIKLFLSIEGSMFVIGIDQDIVAEGIKLKYFVKERSESEWSINYLEKIIQLPFRLPPIRKDKIAENFINNISSSSDEIDNFSKIFSEVGGNPRTVKRVINNFKLQRILSRKRALDIEDEIIAKFIVLEFRWPQFYRDFINLYSINNINLISLVNGDDNNLSIVARYKEDETLLKFISMEPDFRYEISNLDNYIHLARTNIQIKEDFQQTIKNGILNIELKNADKAIGFLSKALVLNESSFEAYYYRAIAHIINNNIELFNLDIERCSDYLKNNIDKIPLICELLIENKQYLKGKIYNEKLLNNEKTHTIGLENIIKMSNYAYSDEEIIDAACCLLSNNGYKHEYYYPLTSRLNFINKISNIEACLIAVKSGNIDYKLMQHCIGFYIEGQMYEKAGYVYFLEGHAKLSIDKYADSFNSFYDAIKTSKYDYSIITKIVEVVILNNLSFDFFNYITKKYLIDKEMLSTIEQLLLSLSQSDIDSSWNKEYALSEIRMVINNKELLEDFEEYLRN